MSDMAANTTATARPISSASWLVESAAPLPATCSIPAERFWQGVPERRRGRIAGAIEARLRPRPPRQPASSRADFLGAYVLASGFVARRSRRGHTGSRRHRGLTLSIKVESRHDSVTPLRFFSLYRAIRQQDLTGRPASSARIFLPQPLIAGVVGCLRWRLGRSWAAPLRLEISSALRPESSCRHRLAFCQKNSRDRRDERDHQESRATTCLASSSVAWCTAWWIPPKTPRRRPGGNRQLLVYADSVVARLICDGSTRRRRRIDRVNSSERKKPPTTRMMRFQHHGVVT